MRVRVMAVGTRMPDWVDAAFADYSRRLRSSMPLELLEIPTAARSGTADTRRLLQLEAKRILPLLTTRDHVVALDERGSQMSTLELSHWLAERRQSGQDLAFIIGGPDGLDGEVLARSQLRWSLSRLTLPHGLVRVILGEQLYRASTVLAGHPYHRP